MRKQVAIHDPQGTGEAEEPTEPPRFDERIRRLEDAIATMQDATHLEDRVLARLTEKFNQARTEQASQQHAVMVEAPRLLPAPAGFASETTPPPLRHPEIGLRPAWFLFDLLADIRAMYRMFVDPRYALGWQGRLVPIALVLAIMTSLVWIPGITFIPGMFATVVDKAIDLLLACVLFRVLFREARRYRETAPDLPPALRL